MSNIDKIKVGGVDYEIVDAQSRQDIEALKTSGGKVLEIEDLFKKGEDLETIVDVSDVLSLKPGDKIKMTNRTGTYSNFYEVLNNYNAGRDTGKIYIIDEYGDLRYVDEDDVVAVFKVANKGGGTVDAYTKAESDEKFALKTDAQEKLEGSYISNLYQGGANNIGYNIKTYNDKKSPDGQIGNIYLKTINGETIFGQGDIQIEGGDNIVGITQAEYDKLGDDVKDDTLYVITDAEGVDVSDFASKDELNGKQNKLTGDYVKDVEVGGSYLNFNSMKFDGNNNGSKSVNFKTVGGQPIFGAGDISLPKIWSGTKTEYDNISNKDANTIYLIHD